MMYPIICPETSVRNYHYSLRSNPEERSSHLCRGRKKHCQYFSFRTLEITHYKIPYDETRVEVNKVRAYSSC